MTAPDAITGLIERFDSHREMYRSGRYNETMLRRDFLDPLFRALGWDVDNQQGYAEAYREVVHEDAIKVGGSTKAPDYCFRVGGGQRSFFVEAKKPSVDIHQDIGPAFQLRRYAWSAKLPVSILTDFEEFAVYDCRIRPVKTDRASTARVMYLKYTEYADRWNELAGLFSPDAIRRGLLDKFVASKRIKKGTAEVDTAFLEEIESWRTVLARNIALRNKNISQRDLNFAVQRTIDRMIFLRICEDRGIEQYGRLQSLQNGTKVYRRLAEMFQRADERYNSGLFHFTPEKDRPEPPDELTLALAIDDKPLKDIVRNLYFPDSPYEFAVLPAEILGQVYEQFLGKVIRLTKGHQAKVEEKPEVRKAGGVYYTPAYIVDYIVRHTVGKMLEGKSEGPGAGGQGLGGKNDTRLAAAGTAANAPRGKTMTPKQAAKLKILDPACGSGSFLIGAYQFLLDWHRDWYTADDAEKHARGRSPKLYRDRSGQWRLTTTEKKRILLNNIYGVDIDPQAVEVTKLSLLLKVLEGESQETLSNQLRLFHERALPDLAGNIKCGNSLIGPDFYEGRQMSLLDEEEVFRINAFDWPAEFPEVFKGKNPGFDAVIGNPPYIFARDKGFTIPEKTYFKSKFQHQSFQLHSFTLFVEQCFYLLREQGQLGFIIPNNWFSIPTMKPFRDFIVGSTGNVTLVNNTFKVFGDANVDTSVVLFTKGEPTYLHLCESCEPTDVCHVAQVDPRVVLADPIIQFRLYKTPGVLSLLQTVESNSIALGEIALVKAGLKAYETGKGNPKQTDVMKKNRVYHARDRLGPDYRVYLDGKDVKRYSSGWSGEYLKYGPNLAAPRGMFLFEGERILVRQIPSRPPYSINATIFSGEELNDINSMIVKVNDNYSLAYLLGLLNSRLLTFWFDYRYDKFQRGIFPQFKVVELASFPIHVIDFSEQKDKSRHDRMVELVENMLSLHKRLSSAQTPHEKTLLQRQIDATDNQIDRLVYELYELTDAEIAIVEGL